MYSFARLKWKERKEPRIRKAFSLREILLMAIPSYLSILSGSFYYVLQRLLEDELVIHVVERGISYS